MHLQVAIPPVACFIPYLFQNGLLSLRDGNMPIPDHAQWKLWANILGALGACLNLLYNISVLVARCLNQFLLLQISALDNQQSHNV